MQHSVESARSAPSHALGCRSCQQRCVAHHTLCVPPPPGSHCLSVEARRSAYFRTIPAFQHLPRKRLRVTILLSPPSLVNSSTMTIKILALCGFTQNATIYSKQVSTFKRLAATAGGVGSGLAWQDRSRRHLVCNLNTCPRPVSEREHQLGGDCVPRCPCPCTSGTWSMHTPAHSNSCKHCR